jgi:hypothetical protein
MHSSQLEEIRERIERAFNVIEHNSCTGFNQTHILEDGALHHYRIYGIKSPEQLNDELLTLFVWLWSMKDYLKQSCKAKGIDPQRIEDIANNNVALQLVSDIANSAKHGELEKSRSGKSARLTDVGFELPQTAISSLCFEADTVTVNVHAPSEARFKARIAGKSGEDIGDAFEILQLAMLAWETQAMPIVLDT